MFSDLRRLMFTDSGHSTVLVVSAIKTVHQLSKLARSGSLNFTSAK